jgi:hypothetical protein
MWADDSQDLRESFPGTTDVPNVNDSHRQLPKPREIAPIR